MERANVIDKDIIDHYDSGVELNRLNVGTSQLERVRTQEIILRYLRKTPSRVLDVGAGPGFYSFWLSDLGHEVHLVDPVLKHAEYARIYAAESHKKIFSITVGEAQHLEYDSEYFDIVLMLGPLYHLTEKDARLRALSEARRVLSKGGVLFCVAVSRYASMLDGYFRNLISDPRFVEIMNRDLQDGQHRNNTENLDYWTTAYLHKPHELKDEVTESGLRLEDMFAIDSFGWLIPNFQERWHDKDYRDLLLHTIRAIEKDTSLMGMSAHIIGVATKR
jgi:ubiquinone/menaquinone biosynthesis C-methylase UbiE